MIDIEKRELRKSCDKSNQGFSLISSWWQLKYFSFSTRKLGNDSHFDQYFSKGLKPPTRSDLFLNPKNLRFFADRFLYIFVRGFYDPVGGKVLVNGEDGEVGSMGRLGESPCNCKVTDDLKKETSRPDATLASTSTIKKGTTSL